MEKYLVELKVSCEELENVSSYFNTILMMAKGFGISVEESRYSLPEIVKPLVEPVPEKTPKKRFMNVDEAAAYLGIKKNTVYNYVCTRKIPFYKIGSRTQFDISELDEWVEATRTEAIN